MMERIDTSSHPQDDAYFLPSYRRLVQQSHSSLIHDDNWLITLSDVFSLLLIFLIMFLIMSKNSAPVIKKQTSKEYNDVLPYDEIQHKSDIIGKRLRDSIVSQISNLDLGDDVSILATNREIIVTMREKISFTPGEAEILSSTKPVLGQIADIIRRYPRFHIEISGHTDNVPINTHLYPSNWELSVARATSVLKYLINTYGIDPTRMSIKGNADKNPRAPNDTPEQRALNRRVEIKLKEVQS